MEAATIINNEAGLGSDLPDEEVSTPVEEFQPPIFKYAEHVHLPEDCDAGVACTDPDHFHAWLRLPNKFQHKEIREKALAARARRLRVLRDEDGDSRVILEGELDLLRNVDQATLVEEIISQDGGKDMLEALRDVGEIEDEVQPDEGETVYKYAHIEDDESRLAELDAMPDEERPGEEYENLTKHAHSYYKAVEERQREIQQPERDALLERDLDDLIDLVRQHRIDQEGMEEFLHAYNSWQIVYGTMLSDKSGRKFNHLDALKNQASEVVDALVVAFSSLEAGAKAGNS